MGHIPLLTWVLPLQGRSLVLLWDEPGWALPSLHTTALKGEPEPEQEQQHVSRTGQGIVCAVTLEGTTAAKGPAPLSGRWTLGNKFRGDI